MSGRHGLLEITPLNLQMPPPGNQGASWITAGGEARLEQPQALAHPVPTHPHGLTLTQLLLSQHPEDGSWSSPLAPASKALVEKDLTSSEPALATLFCCRSPEPITMCPLLSWVKLRSQEHQQLGEDVFPWIEQEQGKGWGSRKTCIRAGNACSTAG